jgi:demethylmenaquinone methyltransferase/2-methoxy-6-polyprenyl-1,4-benzoquinol methylase
MSNPFYTPGPERAANVEDLFARIAPRYDLINDLQSLGLHRLWKSALVKMAAVKTGDRALDVGCGTGDIALALRRRGAEVTGLDFSPAMLEIARRRAQKGNVSTPARFIQGDAQHLPFEDNAFDIVTAGYALRNLSSWEDGLEEMRRVARPGGRLLVLDFGKPDNRFWRSVYSGYLRFFVPVFGRIFCKNAATHSYIYASLQDYPAQRGIAEKMKALGCGKTTIRNLAGGAMSINFALK